jgi:hypothetical protein
VRYKQPMQPSPSALLLLKANLLHIIDQKHNQTSMIAHLWKVTEPKHELNTNKHDTTQRHSTYQFWICKSPGVSSAASPAGCHADGSTFFGAAGHAPRESIGWC